ncbi:CDP-Glycerol:Poly(glycerophosphate) glycerophosphotransferase [Flavobacteriaceae bacterium MAR_2010_188]|nr:CDP-Glycerol:Poly(glycerophosphate) glycerophosphotransferase [Flavobacteriaceae bacterium MAR_2010_188]
MSRYKIAFLHLDEIHHINHFISVAIELSKEHDVEILTFPGKHDYLLSTLKNLNGKAVKVEQLPTMGFRALTDRLKGRELPRKGFWLKKNKNYILDTFDAVVFTDYFHHELFKSRKDAKKPKFLKFAHGAPGRSYSFRKDQADFDFQLLYSDFQFQELKKRGLLGEHPVVVGYPKVDSIVKTKISFFKNDNPVVVYNPHFSQPLSSWHYWGQEILNFFLENKDFNLIFAPHINLFKHKGGLKPDLIDQKFYKPENIYIDLGSEKSVNMTYVNAADIYLGDVSSQVYEFIIKPRPCVFLNPTAADYKESIEFRFWKCGKVVSDLSNLSDALNKSQKDFNEFKTIQQKITDENFYTEENTTASERAALAIVEYLDNSL